MHMAARAVNLFKVSGRLQNKPYRSALYPPNPAKFQVFLVCRTDQIECGFLVLVFHSVIGNNTIFFEHDQFKIGPTLDRLFVADGQTLLKEEPHFPTGNQWSAGRLLLVGMRKMYSISSHNIPGCELPL